MNRVIIERPDGTKVTIEGPGAERIARELSPPLHVGPTFPMPYTPAIGGGWYCHSCQRWVSSFEAHVCWTLTTTSDRVTFDVKS